MDLTTQQDKILLKNCILVKIRQLELELDKLKKKSTLLDTSNIENEISLYENLYQLLKADDTVGLQATLNHYKNTDSIRQFSIEVLSNESPKEFAEKYVNLTKDLMHEYNVYSDDDFESLKKAFYQGTNIKYSDTSKDVKDLEEEPNHESNFVHSTPEEEEILTELSHLVKQAKTQHLTADEFKQLSAQFRDFTKLLGINKFQHFFDDKNKTVSDMDISYDTTTHKRPYYSTNLEITDNNGNITEINISEPASNSGFSSTYYQNLCYAYLEADKFANIDTGIIDSDIIASKATTFDNCYRKLEEMVLKCNMKIKDGRIFYHAKSSFEPSDELTIPTSDHTLEANNITSIPANSKPDEYDERI